MGYEHQLFQINDLHSSSHSILLLSAVVKNVLINKIQRHDKHKYTVIPRLTSDPANECFG